VGPSPLQDLLEGFSNEQKPKAADDRGAGGKAVKAAKAEDYIPQQNSSTKAVARDHPFAPRGKRAGVEGGKAGNWVVIATAAHEALDLARSAWSETNQMRLKESEFFPGHGAEDWRSVLGKLAQMQEILRRGIKGVR
jgi:hypothetical protein